jgi:tight adherence protein B
VLAAAADSERVRVRSTRVSRARTAGSLAALPVGLAFLPAFVLVAVVPIVVGSLSAMLAAG